MTASRSPRACVACVHDDAAVWAAHDGVATLERGERDRAQRGRADGVRRRGACLDDARRDKAGQAVGAAASAARSAARPCRGRPVWHGRAAARCAHVRRPGRRRPERLRRLRRSAARLARCRCQPSCRDPRPGVARWARRCWQLLGAIGHDQLGGDRRRRRAHVGGELRERHVGLVADADDDRSGQRRDGAHDGLRR